MTLMLYLPFNPNLCTVSASQRQFTFRVLCSSDHNVGSIGREKLKRGKFSITRTTLVTSSTTIEMLALLWKAFRSQDQARTVQDISDDAQERAIHWLFQRHGRATRARCVEGLWLAESHQLQRPFVLWHLVASQHYPEMLTWQISELPSSSQPSTIKQHLYLFLYAASSAHQGVARYQTSTITTAGSTN